MPTKLVAISWPDCDSWSWADRMDAEELAHECEHQRQWDAAFVDLDAETLETAADIVDADAMTCVEGTPQYERLSEVADQLRAAARALEADLAAG